MASLAGTIDEAETAAGLLRDIHTLESSCLSQSISNAPDHSPLPLVWVDLGGYSIPIVPRLPRPSSTRHHPETIGKQGLPRLRPHAVPNQVVLLQT